MPINCYKCFSLIDYIFYIARRFKVAMNKTVTYLFRDMELLALYIHITYN